jgi:hypothetical protein
MLIVKPKRFQILFFLSLLFFLLVSIFFYDTKLIKALTQSLVQSSWSGGADTEATINSTNLSGWGKYYSKSSGVDTDTEGIVRLKVGITQP